MSPSASARPPPSSSLWPTSDRGTRPPILTTRVSPPGLQVAKEGGERWKSMTEEEKKPYVDEAAELNAHDENGEGSGENNVAVEKPEADGESEQEVDQPANDEEDEAGDQEDEEKNELDDDLDDDM
uniref:HMG box domain-containing protein n=1 Tax=Arundo donax TaxID=35708 RepID=A0A0A9H4W2_ARUDO